VFLLVGSGENWLLLKPADLFIEQEITFPILMGVCKGVSPLPLGEYSDHEVVAEGGDEPPSGSDTAVFLPV
jgi:hypothetical protein